MKKFNNKKAIILVAFMLVIGITSSFLVSAAIWRYGSTHVHTEYSSVPGGCWKEPFSWNGYSVAQLKLQALNQNIHWLTFSDHSYCLSSSEFYDIKSDCQYAQDAEFTCLWGEELSVRDDDESWGEEILCVECLALNPDPLCPAGMDNEWHTTACHVGTYGNSDYIAQSPSNVWCPDTLGTQQGINTIDDEGGISIINHPHTDFGVWDCDSVDGISGETGIEIWNGEWDSRDEQAKDTWLDKIQDGDKVLALGGSDSHGQVSGLSTNYNYAGMSSITHANLEEGLASGANMISNDGGYLRISAKTNTQSTWTEMGGEFDAYTNEIITIRVKHNLVHGCNLQVRRGEIGYSGEDYASFYVSGQDEFDVPYPIIDSGEYYFRAECISSGGDYRLYTNPIWVNVYYMPDDEICNDGLDNDNDGYADCADGDCTLGTSCGSNKWCCGSGCSSNGGTCACPSSSGITCADGNCNTYGEACCDGELERDMECSGTSLDCVGTPGTCEYSCGAPQWCDELEGECEESPGSYDELQCEVDGTNCYYEAEYSCGAPDPCDGLDENDCSDNTGFQCEWQGTYDDNVVEECESTSCGAISQCDEEDPGYDYTSCTTGGQTYFADQCSSSCQGEDRGDDVCRSSAFASGCTADSECNGVAAGSGNCDNSCNYVPPQADGEPCSADAQCISSYCDNDGVGLADDGWCFTPYNTYFDGEETSFCEYSTSYGVSDCDERQVGGDINKCVGISYYEDECSSSCNYQDITSVFECGDSGCSCTEPLCDGMTAEDNVTTCTAGETYFADECTSTAGGVDRGDNICRSSTFASGCTADSECDGDSAGVGECDATCSYNQYPSSPLILHPDGGESVSGYATINWTQSTDLEGAPIRYFLQYSNNSGVGWYDIILYYGFENMLHDSSTEKELIFTGYENQTIYIKIPKNAVVTQATLDLTGLVS